MMAVAEVGNIIRSFRRVVLFGKGAGHSQLGHKLENQSGKILLPKHPILFLKKGRKTQK